MLGVTECRKDSHIYTTDNGNKGRLRYFGVMQKTDQRSQKTLGEGGREEGKEGGREGGRMGKREGRRGGSQVK